MAILIVAFALAALLYASVGFGGGSTYSALLSVAGVDYRILPLVALACNIVVVLGSTIRFARAGQIPWRKALGLTALSAPTALLGGLTPIDERSFFALLGVSLLLTAAAMIVPAPLIKTKSGTAKWVPAVAIPLGYLAGVVGIGGGIFLAPLLHLTRWEGTRAIAAIASVFILVNSLFGIAGQVLKGGSGRLSAAIELGLPLLIAVAVGGQVGSLMASRLLPEIWVRRLTAILIAVIGARLIAGL